MLELEFIKGTFSFEFSIQDLYFIIRLKTNGVYRCHYLRLLITESLFKTHYLFKCQVMYYFQGPILAVYKMLSIWHDKEVKSWILSDKLNNNIFRAFKIICFW